MSNDSQPGKPSPETAGDPECFQGLLAQETVPVPEYLKLRSAPDLGHADLSVERYTSPEFFRLEAQRLWPKVWQLVTREENIPAPGDHVVYDIVDASVIVLRGDDGIIRGFINSCLHRGRALRQTDGCVAQIRCPFHGFTWDLRGNFKSLPCAWDFQHLKRETLSLPQVRVENWGGFVFINFDDEAPPLLEYLGVLPEHFARFPLHDYFTAIHVQKAVPCNWKVAQEAFFEAMHSTATHPEILSYTADVDSQYDTFGEHISRMITPFMLPSPNLPGVTQERIVQEALMLEPGADRDVIEHCELPPGVNAREFLGERRRLLYAAATGTDLSQATHAELLDAILYAVFPNTQIWAGYFGNLVYRFIPDGSNPDRCKFDVRILARVPEGTPPPPPAPVRQLDENDSFTTIAEWGSLGQVFDQDMRNLRCMTKGLKASRNGAVSLANYQESRIRHLHRTLDHYLGIGAAENGRVSVTTGQ